MAEFTVVPDRRVKENERSGDERTILGVYHDINGSPKENG